MDLEPVKNRNPSHEATYPTMESSPSKEDKILQESMNHTQKSPTETNLDTDNDQNSAQTSEPISKHVLSTNLDNVSPSDTCTFCDKINNPKENCEETSTRENNDGTEV